MTVLHIHCDKYKYRLCPLCASECYRVLFEDINRREGLALSATLVECCSCGMRYLNPAPDAESLGKLYSSGAVDIVDTDLERVSTVSPSRPAASVLRSILHDVNGLLRGQPHNCPDEDGMGRSILDFGCHDGCKLSHWYQRGWQVAGVDLNENAIAVARRRFLGGRFWCGDLIKLDIQDRYDVIRADNVVEHLYEPVVYLSALAKLLKPGGFLRVFVPNGAALSVLLFGRYSYVYWLPFHLNFFTQKTLCMALERAGLSKVKCTAFSPIGSWMHTQRQILLSPGFDRRPTSWLDRMIRSGRLLNYPGETITQWLGLGEEVVGTGQLAQ